MHQLQGHFIIKSSWKGLCFNFRMHNVDFIQTDLPWTRSLSFSKFLRNCGNMPKRCLHALHTLKKHKIMFKETSCGQYCCNMTRGQLLAVIKSLYKQSEDCVCVNDMKIKPFSVSVGLQQGCVLSALLYIIYYTWARYTETVPSVVASHLGSVMFCACFLQMILHC